MTRCSQLAATLVCASAWSVIAASPAWGHAKVVQVEPGDGAVLGQPPGEVRIRFNEAIEPAFTTLRLLDAAGKPLALPASAMPTSPAAAPTAATVTDRTAVLALPSALAAGRYTVHWATVGPDGHRVQGDVHFTVK